MVAANLSPHSSRQPHDDGRYSDHEDVAFHRQKRPRVFTAIAQNPPDQLGIKSPSESE